MSTLARNENSSAITDSRALNSLLKMFQDESYFKNYENLEVHEIMLRDRPRQEAYIKAIELNPSYFKDKFVLDVGAGTGILSVLCARAGAKLVYAVEASNLAEIALKVMEDNGVTSVVKVIKSKIEDFILPSSAEKVDVIISEWMGFYLLHEGMLDSVLFARDNFLKPEGLLFPSEATIYVAPCAVPHLFDDWSEYDGVCLDSFATMLRRQKSSKPEIAIISPNNLLHEGVAMHWMSLKDVTSKDLDNIAFQEVLAARKAGKHQGFCIWFDCRFPTESFEESVILSTNPNSLFTHWKQCIVVLPTTSCEELDEGDPISFKITMQRNSKNNRNYGIEVEILDPNEIEHPVPCDCHLTKCILIKAHLQKMDMT